MRRSWTETPQRDSCSASKIAHVFDNNEAAWRGIDGEHNQKKVQLQKKALDFVHFCLPAIEEKQIDATHDAGRGTRDDAINSPFTIRI